MKNCIAVLCILLLSFFSPTLSSHAKGEDDIQYVNDNVQLLIDSGYNVEDLAQEMYAANLFEGVSDDVIRAMYLCFELEMQGRNIPTANTSHIDLSTLTYSELLNLRSEVECAIIQSEEWRTVTVPVGIYDIGSDIPAGAYSLISAPTNTTTVSLLVLDSSGATIRTWNLLTAGSEIGRISFDEGQSILISGGEIVFTPYVGLGWFINQ